MLKLHKVCKRFGDSVDAVLDVDLHVRPGEFVFLLGPSGSGKTTTLRMIAGFGRPTSGSIELAGKSIADVPPHRRDIGMVFQRYALFPHLTVWDNTAFGLKMRGMPERDRPGRIEQTLAMVRLDGLEKRFPHELSGGQQQRVALARALAYRPALLLLDEPLANLDRRLRDEMRVELKRIQKEAGTTMLFVTHDFGVLASLCDAVSVLYAGRVAEAGPTRAVLEAPAHPYTRMLLACHPDRAVELAGIPGTVPPATAQPSGCRFHPRCPLAQPDCATVVPPLLPLGAAREVACPYHARELALA